MSTQADLRARDIVRSTLETDFEVIYRNQSLGRVTVGKPGTHNVLNALGAILVGLELNIGMEDIKKGLVNLGGLARRFQIKGEKGGILVLDDYGHHPTEIAATLETARTSWPDRRLIVVFQPHRFSRTKLLYDRFVIAFNDADRPCGGAALFGRRTPHRGC
jgi:UDP-N-acetylmuramate--alanine ligase